MTTLDDKMKFVQTWNRADALACWQSFHNKYEAKHGDALHHVLMNGHLNEYIDRECETFRRYAQHWQYVRWKSEPMFCIVEAYATPPVDAIRTDLHHIAQENKLRRYQRGCQL